MRAMDIMVRDVVTASPDMPVDAVARLLVEKRISAVPVIDAEHRVLGIVSNSDLILRIVGWPAPHETLWMMILQPRSDFSERARKVFGQTVRDVMSSPALTVTPITPASEIAELMAGRKVHHVPVVDGGKLVGIIGRSNLVQAWASAETSSVEPTDEDRKLRDGLTADIRKLNGSAAHLINVVSCDGAAHLWGVVDTAEQAEALNLLVEAKYGADSVKSHVVQSELVPSDLATII